MIFLVKKGNINHKEHQGFHKGHKEVHFLIFQRSDQYHL